MKYVTLRFILDSQYSCIGYKSVLNLRATIIFFGSIQIKAKTSLELLKKLVTSPKTITLSHGGSMLSQFLEFDSNSL